LSGSNRSLFLPRLPAEQVLDLQEFSFLKGEHAFSIVNALIAGKSKSLCQVVDSRMESNNKTSQKLKKLNRIDHFLFDEKGSNDLHVGWPFVHGKFMDGTLVRCPLLYFPVTVEQVEGDWLLKLREDTGITFNKSFLLAYAFYNETAVKEEWLDFSFDDWEKDGTVFRTQLYQFLKDKIELNFNSELFSDELKPFTEFRKAEFDEQHKQGELKLQPEAVIGIFPQAASQLVPDYLSLIDSNKYVELEKLFDERNNPATLRQIKEENYFTPLDVDEWQEHAIQQVKEGKSIVVQGPPGTGKSQLISNLICDAIATGKKVLLVCQKRVALDVVYERLSKLGIQNFVGRVHDFRNDRKEIFSTIASQIESINDFKNQNRSIDSIQVERQFFQVSRSIDTVTEELEEFRAALFHEHECGVSAKELYLTSSASWPFINVKQEYSFFDFRTLPSFVSVVKRYALYAKLFEAEEYPWKHRVSFAHAGFQELNNRLDTIQALIDFKKSFELCTKKLLSSSLSVEDGEALWKNISSIQDMLSLLSSHETYACFESMLSQKEEETSLLWVDNLRLMCMNCFDGEGVEKTISSDQLTKFQHVLQQRMDARKRSFIRLLQWEWFSDDKYLLKRVLVANNLQYNRADLQKLEVRLDNRLNLEHHLTALRTKEWLIHLPTQYESAVWMKWFSSQKDAITAKLLFASLREIKGQLSSTILSYKEFHQLFNQLIPLLHEITVVKQQWELHLSGFQIRVLLETIGLQEKLSASLKNDFEDLVVFDGLKKELSANEKVVIEKLFQSINEWNAEAFERLLQNSLRLEWLHHLETKYPSLRLVSTQRFYEMENELRAAVVEKQRLSKELLVLRAREQVYEHIEYNRLNNPITYRDLQHQVTKKKKIWPLRKVIGEYQHELFNLVPCWMASPESVSALFPMDMLFDLVIFDEASQCFAERGIPAIARGKQLVVAGDSQQLQPSDLYQLRWNEESEAPDSEVDSLLALTERYLPTIHLQGHYRSKSKELIDFSNQHFYKNRLKMLPDFDQANSKEASIQVVKVTGIWEEQCNAVEAAEVVKQVLQLLKQYPEKEVGVITFNAPQQHLIYDLLETSFAQEQLPWPTSLIVKNIENVQGDEKDIIIFSIGYAADKKGKLHLQFGSLSQAGGENRLNVAITRAREKIVVVTSIHPEQLEVDDAKNEGPRLLRKYLEHARTVSSLQQTLPLFSEGASHSRDWYLSSKLHSEFVKSSPLPFSEMIVSRLNKYEALLLTDDEHYRTALSAKAAHAYLPLLLEKKKWDFVRLFSRNYWMDTEKTLLDIRKITG
jgi:superfamily I DNA and/or RNA helicase